MIIYDESTMQLSMLLYNENDTAVCFSGKAKRWFEKKLDICLLIKETMQFKVIHFLLHRYAFVECSIVSLESERAT